MFIIPSETMKSLLYTRFNQKYMDATVLLIRICIGAFMLTHGIPKFARFFADDPVSFIDPFGIGEVATLALVVFAEVFCSIFIMLGLLTRVAAIPLIINMAVISFMVHAGEAFSDKELALMYLVAYIIILAAGGGRFSIDHYLYYKRR